MNYTLKRANFILAGNKGSLTVVMGVTMYSCPVFRKL